MHFLINIKWVFKSLQKKITEGKFREVISLNTFDNNEPTSLGFTVFSVFSKNNLPDNPFVITQVLFDVANFAMKISGSV